MSQDRTVHWLPRDEDSTSERPNAQEQDNQEGSSVVNIGSRARHAAHQVRIPPLTNAERQRRFRERARLRSIRVVQEQASNPPQIDPQTQGRDDIMDMHWQMATLHFNKVFKSNAFGHSCDVCDRLWFQNDLKKVQNSHVRILEPFFGGECASFSVCANCLKTLKRNKLPQISTTNGFKYPYKPANLPELDPISARLISPRIPFMAIRRLRRDGGYGIIGQVINIPVEVNNMIRHLPRNLDDDYAINVAIKRKLIHKSSYLSGYVQKRTVKAWLTYLVEQPLYRHYNITIDQDFLRTDEGDNAQDDLIDDFGPDNAENEVLLARQHTLLWNEENVLEIAPGQGRQPLNIIFDEFAEELSFPQIYYGVGRTFNPNISVTPYMIANSEIRRKDRRGVTPEHILYMAMKILRLRVVDGVRNTFRCIRETENINRRMIEDPKFLEECVEKNLSFLKSIPNSINYWMARKKDLFAMMRQLGKPTMFLTMSANEIKWPDLLSLLHRLSNNGEGYIPEEIFTQLDRSKCAKLVNEDPVTCCIYFQKLIETIFTMLKSKRRYNPFGKYRVKDYFLRIEFQHRGSPHVHSLLWLDNDPNESISEDMPATVQLVTNLCSVSEVDIPNMYANQVHRHTFTCTKRGESSCRFNIPYWPMYRTRILLPLQQNHIRLGELRQTARRIKKLLETKVYETISAFLSDANLDEPQYLNVVRSTLNKPTLCFKRNMSEIMTNTFNPWIASVLNSNMDIQFIVEEYSCAAYVVDYVNKSNRGMSNLHRELIKLNETHPDMTQENLLRKLGAKVLNTVELSAQEAAWYLLRQNMSESSREVVFIPTNWPCERKKSYKTKAQLDQANVSPESTDIWSKSIIQHYEERPAEFDPICLADFAAWYTTRSRASREIEEAPLGVEEDPESNQVEVPRAAEKYYRREFSRVIRYINYDSSDTNNYKRELVTLFVPFRNELVDVIDRNKFIQVYDTKLQEIASKMKEYTSGCNIEQILEEMRTANNQSDDLVTVDVIMERENFVRDLLDEGNEENFDDLNQNAGGNVVSAVTTRENVLSKEEYCTMMRTTNRRQRELILEFVHRLKSTNAAPIQVFFTGPAGCGKTYVLKLIMETLNRYSQNQNALNNAYVACASTGKASVGLHGTTVHSAFHITQSKRQGPIARESLHRFRQLFANVNCIIIDEVSMIGNDILHKVNQRIQQITGELDRCFGDLNMIFCGDFRQLPPVNATPVYKGSRNHLEGALLWQSLDYFNLDQVMRQSDLAFSSILTKIGDGASLSVEEAELLESRFRTEQWCDSNLTNVVRLFHRNQMVDAYNSRAISGGLETVAIDNFIGYATNVELVEARTKLHRLSTVETGGLPYTITLSTGYPYMLTSNTDIEDGLVNGAIGTLQFIERLPSSNEQEEIVKYRAWVEFSEERIGVKARIKHRSSMIAHRDQIQRTWTPISMKTASINLGRTTRCKRTQLPLTPACAITIHKSQGGTFDRAVILYEKSQLNQLVYVALSRVKSIEGLFLINPKNDFKFHHKSGSASPSVKEIRDEYIRLNSHCLPTLTTSIDSFISSSSSSSDPFIICTINAQSLVAHSTDISSDYIIAKSDMLVITETWMDESSPVMIQGYELVASDSQSIERRDEPLEAENALQERRIAGGVAIYKKVERLIESLPLSFSISDSRHVRDSKVGDISIANLKINDRHQLILVAVYIHPSRSKSDVEMFLFYALARFSADTRRIFPHMEIDLDTPMIVTGDFNSNVKNDKWIEQLMQNKFGLSYVECDEPTTLGNTTIDLTFIRGLAAICKPFVSYFSYHRPLFNKILFNV